jgi:hypothetical protein
METVLYFSDLKESSYTYNSKICYLYIALDNKQSITFLNKRTFQIKI